MKRNWTQLLVAFLMGVLMPVMTMQLGQALVSAREETQPQSTLTATAPVQTTEMEIQEMQTLPVLISDSSLQMMALDRYLLGVVLAEMPADFAFEALKAQAVAARTCALQCTQEGTKHPGGAVCTDSRCCQAYIEPSAYLADGGLQENVNKVQKAVTDTTGQVLTYQGELIQATYFSCSGGRTEDAAAVWGADIPYLKSVESPGEEHAQIYSSTASFTAKEFSSLLGRTMKGSCKSWLGPVTRTDGGGVATMVIAGKTYTGTQLRSLLSLNSTAFTMTAQGDTITVTVSGRGHRVGMSQYGADAMAVTGSTYDRILAYYYPGTRIDKLDALG